MGVLESGIWILLLGPVVTLGALRGIGPLRARRAYGAAIAAELASVFLLGQSATYVVRAPFSGPAIPQRIGIIVVAACLIASAFLLLEWIAGRLTSAWSRRGERIRD